VIPVVKKGALAGFAVLENRLTAGAFTPQLVSLTQALLAQAAISLDNASLYEHMEQRVHERTAALHAKNAELQLVFDNVAQGLLMVDRAGRLAAGGSAILASWFPEGLPTTLTAMFAHEPLFDASWEQLLDGFLPPELCIDQLPRYLQRGEQVLELSWRPIADAQGDLVRMLLVMSDITEALRRQEAEQEQRQMMAIFERLSQDRGGVVEFAREATNIVRDLRTGTNSIEVDKRLVHTLKGNCALFGLSGLSSLCHDIESALVLDERGLWAAERAQICDAWKAIESRLSRFLDVGGNYVQVRRPDFESALRALVREGHPVAHDLELWKLETLESRFQRIGEQAQALAERLGKGPVRIVSEHGGIRVSSELWAPLWAAFVHAVRNAIDHGLEPSDERQAMHKGVATLRLSAGFVGASFVLEFSDDGRGVAWDKVRQKARAAGLPADSHEQLVAALFSDGLSTKDAADELSGRGVGMAALADACAAMDATIDIESSSGVGTTFRFTFPTHVAKLPRERRPSMLPSVFPANC
jgi:two-component system chemotaxis sensor kinase CheA